VTEVESFGLFVGSRRCKILSDPYCQAVTESVSVRAFVGVRGTVFALSRSEMGRLPACLLVCLSVGLIKKW